MQGFDDLEPVLRAHGIDGRILPRIDANFLRRALGITNPDTIARFLDALLLLRDDSGASLKPLWMTSKDDAVVEDGAVVSLPSTHPFPPRLSSCQRIAVVCRKRWVQAKGRSASAMRDDDGVVRASVGVPLRP